MHIYNSNRSNNVINNYYGIMRTKVCFMYLCNGAYTRARVTCVYLLNSTLLDFIELKRDKYSK